MLDRDGHAARDAELPRARRRAPQPALRARRWRPRSTLDARRVARARRPRLRASIVGLDARHPGRGARRSSAGRGRRFVQVLLPVRSDVPYGNRLLPPALRRGARAHGLRDRAPRVGPGAAPRRRTTGVTTTYLEDYLSNAHIAEVQLMSLVAEGVFADVPGARRSCSPSAASPGCRRCCGGSTRTGRASGARCRGSRSARRRYVRRHMRLTTAPAQLPQRAGARSPQVVEMVGPEMLLYASDAPARPRRRRAARCCASLGADGRRGDPARATRPPSTAVAWREGRRLRDWRTSPPGERKIVKAGRALDRRLPRRGRVLRHPQPLPAPGRAAVPRAAVGVGGRERPGQGDGWRARRGSSRARGTAGSTTSRPASRSWGRARRA